MQDQFSAAPSALGYFYQCEVALLELLRRADPALDVSIELLDDVAFEGPQVELLQAKYHIEPGNLQDRSADLWKTIRVWSEADAASPEALLTLVTTSTAQPGSIASLLRNDAARDAGLAHSKLVEVARSSSSQAVARAVEAFLKLSDDRRLALVRRILVADGAPTIADLDQKFGRVLHYAAPADRRLPLIRRIREWWLLRAEQHLTDVANGGHPRISGAEIESRLADVRDQLATDNLPNDVEDIASPSDEEVAEDQRPFVMQLRLIALGNGRIRRAVHDYNRAFAQRARWVREDLVAFGELGRYEQRLKEEWERIWLPESDDPQELSDDEARSHGRDVHRACDDAPVEPIRPRVTAPYVMRGSMQMLADELRIGWHPAWVAEMQALLEEVET